jgi:phosphatidylserine decarboxylase
MVTTLLYSESPAIGAVLTLAIPVLYYLQWYVTCAIVTFLFFFFVFFYRHYPCDKKFNDLQVACPADGKVLAIKDSVSKWDIAIFLSPANIHTQIYPVNGVPISHVYDENGNFNLAMDLNKSALNEKMIHTIKMSDGTSMTVTQIAGFLPRRISADDKVNYQIQAGQYLGIIKFGSRVDLSIPKQSATGRTFKLNIAVDDRVNIGDLIGEYI